MNTDWKISSLDSLLLYVYIEGRIDFASFAGGFDADGVLNRLGVDYEEILGGCGVAGDIGNSFGVYDV